MEKIAWVIGACAVLSAVSAAPAAAQTVVYKAALGGSAEAPPVSTAGNGTGFGQRRFRHEAAVVAGRLCRPRRDPVGAHIHCGAPSGANAPIAVPLGTPPNLAKIPIQGSGAMTDAQLQQLRSGLCYVNIHTEMNKPGEIRGQLTP